VYVGTAPHTPRPQGRHVLRGLRKEKMINDLIKQKERVEFVLEKYPSTRDSDKLLWLAYLVIFHDLKNVLGEEHYELLKSVVMDKTCPTMESIRRLRQKFQEGGKFVGTKREVKLREESLVREWAIQTSVSNTEPSEEPESQTSFKQMGFE